MSVDNDDPYSMAAGLDDLDDLDMDNFEPAELPAIGKIDLKQPPPIPSLENMKLEPMDMDIDMEDLEDYEIPAGIPALNRAESSEPGPLVMERKHTIGALSNVNEVEEDKEEESKHCDPQSNYSGG